MNKPENTMLDDIIHSLETALCQIEPDSEIINAYIQAMIVKELVTLNKQLSSVIVGVGVQQEAVNTTNH